jgi:ABC-type transport system involved in multi-copper enzyme maturation permease subunit
MDNVLSIARTTYWRHAGSKALYLLWIILIGLVAVADRYDVLSIGRANVLMLDLGLMLIAVVGAGSVLILGFEVPRELRQKIAENLLSKPVGRDQYLTGKFLGTVMFALTNVIFVSIGVAVVILVTQDKLSRDLIVALIGVVGMVIVLAAAGAFFGAFLNEVPAVIATFLVFWLGHSTQAIAKMADGMTGVGRMILRAIYGVLPNLGLLNTRDDISQTMFEGAAAVSWSYAGLSFAYALLYAIVLFVAALLVFRRRDL